MEIVYVVLYAELFITSFLQVIVVTSQLAESQLAESQLAECLYVGVRNRVRARDRG